MVWILRHDTRDAFNLDNICHIWIDKSVNGYSLCGEMIHNGEEVVLSRSYENSDILWDEFSKSVY